MHQFNYREVFTTTVVDWLQADSEVVDATLFGAWVGDRLNLIGNCITATMETFIEEINYLQDGCPNVVKDEVVFALSRIELAGQRSSYWTLKEN